MCDGLSHHNCDGPRGENYAVERNEILYVKYTPWLNEFNRKLFYYEFTSFAR